MNDKECLKNIGPFLERLIKPRHDEFETNDYICNSTDCKNALEAYQQWQSLTNQSVIRDNNCPFCGLPYNKQLICPWCNKEFTIPDG